MFNATLRAYCDTFMTKLLLPCLTCFKQKTDFMIQPAVYADSHGNNPLYELLHVRHHMFQFVAANSISSCDALC